MDEGLNPDRPPGRRPDWRSRRSLATLGLLGALAGTLLGLTGLNDRFNARRQAEPPERVLYLPRGDSLKFMCLGYDGIAADLIWIRSVMYVGRRMRDRDRKYEWLEKLYRVTTDLDPHWREPYRVGAILLSALPQDDERAMNLLRRGLERNPADWQMAYQAAKLNMLRGRNREALKWLNLISRTMPGHTPVVEATATRLRLEHHDYPEALRGAAMSLRSGPGEIMRAVDVSNYREALARLLATDLSEWSRRYRDSTGHPAANLGELLQTRFGRAGGGGRAASVREHLYMRLARLTGPEVAVELARALPADPYGMEFRLRVDGEVSSQGMDRLELFRLIQSLNVHLGNFARIRGRPAGSLDELQGYFLDLYRTNQLTPGMAGLLGRPPRLPAHPSGDPAGWSKVPLVDGLLKMPPGPTVEEMRSAPLAMPSGSGGDAAGAARAPARAGAASR